MEIKGGGCYGAVALSLDILNSVWLLNILGEVSVGS